MKKIICSICLGLAITGPVSAQIDVGEEVPDIKISEWHNHPAISLDSIKNNRVIVYCFLRLGTTSSLFFLDSWKELRTTFSGAPVTFLVVTSESPKMVVETIDREEITAPIIFNKDDQAARDFKVQTFPSVFVEAVNGRIAFMGDGDSIQEVQDTINEALLGAHPFPELDKKMASVTRHLDKWNVGLAYREIDKKLEKGRLTDEQVTMLNDTRAIIDNLTTQLDQAALVAEENENWTRAVVALNRLIVEHKGIKAAETAADRLKALKENEDLAKEIKAALEFARAERFEREKNWKRAFKTYSAVSKGYPNTQAGKEAAGLAKYLERRAK